MRLIVFLSFLCIGINLHGHTLFADSVEWDVTDSLIYLPAYDDYCHWEQATIWGKRENLAKMDGTFSLTLIEDSCQFKAPIFGRVTSEFGWRSHQPHYGIDLKLEKGDTICAVFEGVVRIAKYSPSYGNVVVIRHQNGLETLYAHLSAISVSAGDVVDVGHLIGLGGNTGRSSGSHLHFEVRYLGEPIDPHFIFQIADDVFALQSWDVDLSKEAFQLASEARKQRYHKVRSGESLWLISQKYNVSVRKLCALNGIGKKSTLRVGQKVRYR